MSKPVMQGIELKEVEVADKGLAVHADERLIIRGGKPLSGTVQIAGAKNSVLKMMAAAILSSDVCVLKNVPDLTDVHMMAEVIRQLGAKVTVNGSEVTIDASSLTNFEASYELVSQFRASFVVLGPTAC